MTIVRNILGEKTGSIFGHLEIVLSEKELEQAYKEYVEFYLQEEHKES